MAGGADGIVPPQGYSDGAQKVKYFYGLPFSMPTGGAGIKIAVIVRPPLNPVVKSAGASRAAIIAGDLIPTVRPPTVNPQDHRPKNGAGSRVIYSTPATTPKSGSGSRAFIIPIPVIVVKSGGGSTAGNQGL